MMAEKVFVSMSLVCLQTYTALGTPGNAGLIPRAVEQLFTSAKSLESSQGWAFQMKVQPPLMPLIVAAFLE